MRTIVFSDAHGEPDIIQAVVARSGYDARADRLVFAGDAIEVGRDSLACLELLDDLGAECLVGNHEYAVFVGWPIEFDPLDPEVVSRVSDDIGSGRWKLAAEVDGVLVSHAGVSSRYVGDFECAGAGDVARFAAALNDEFEGAVELGELATEGVVDEEGPLWWRPGYGPGPLPDVIQVIGHTPPEIVHEPDAAAHWAEQGVYLIDPFVRGWRGRGFGGPVPCRYAVIEAGEVRVEG